MTETLVKTNLPQIRKEVLAIAGVAAIASAFIPLSYDEAYWLGIWGMWSEGADLYDTALDNKSPVVYLVLGAIEAIPGSFQLGRALVIGLLVFLVGHGVWGRAESRGSEGRVVVAFLGSVIVLLTGFTLQTELMAAPLAVMSLLWGRRQKPMRAGLAAVAATCITPLAVGFIPVSLILASGAPRDRHRSAIAVTAGVSLAIGLVIIGVEDLRYGLIELNLASRQTLGSSTGSGPLMDRVMLTVLSVFPLVVFGIVRRWTWATVWPLIVIAAPSLVAGAFPHYWILPTAAAITLSHRQGASPSSFGGRSLALVVISVMPLLAWSVLQAGQHVRNADPYTEVVETLAALEVEGWTFAQFDLQPYVTAAYPERAALRSPSINYLIWDTSRGAQHRGELPAILASSDVLIEPGLTDPELAIPDTVAHLVPVFRDAIREFDCSVDVEHLRIHLRERLCSRVSTLLPATTRFGGRQHRSGR